MWALRVVAPIVRVERCCKGCGREECFASDKRVGEDGSAPASCCDGVVPKVPCVDPNPLVNKNQERKKNATHPDRQPTNHQPLSPSHPPPYPNRQHHASY